MHFDSALYVAAYYIQNMVLLWMHLSAPLVFCPDLRLEFSGKTIAGLSTADHHSCYFCQTMVLIGVGTIGLVGF